MKIVKKIIFSLLLVGGFFLSGYMYGCLMDSYNIELSLPSGMLALALVFLKIGIYTYISIIIHELGHLIFGLLSGYKFLSFRVGTIILIKVDGKYKIRRFNIPGTAGQCLLDPPDLNGQASYPYKLYNLGVGLLNILVFILSLLGLGLVDKGFRLDIALFGLMNLFSGILNLFPLGGRINNDGKNQLLLEDENNRLYFWKSLKINKELLYGRTMEEMDPYYFSYVEYVDGSGDNSLRDSIVINNINLHMDRGDFNLAREKIRGLLSQDSLMEIYRNELRCDLIFLEVLDGNKEQLDRLMSPSIEKYIKATGRYFIGRKRLEYAINLLIEGDLARAADSLADFKRLAKTYPYPGEVKMEEKLLAYIGELYESKLPGSV